MFFLETIAKEKSSIVLSFDENYIDNDTLEIENPETFFSEEYEKKIDELQGNIESYVSAVDASKHSAEDFVNQIINALTGQVLGPLGVGADVFKDQTGGNVTTSHNAKQDIFAHPETEGFKRKEYTGNAFNKARENAIQKNKDKNGGKIICEYQKGNVDITYNAQADHYISVHAMHRDGAWRATAEQKDALGSAEGNLFMVDSSLNASKNDKDAKDWAGSKASDSDQTNAEKYNIDPDKLAKCGEQAEETIQELMPNKVQAITYDVKMMAKEGAKAGAKSALRAAVLNVIGKFVEGIISIKYPLSSPNTFGLITRSPLIGVVSTVIFPIFVWFSCL